MVGYLSVFLVLDKSFQFKIGILLRFIDFINKLQHLLRTYGEYACNRSEI